MFANRVVRASLTTKIAGLIGVTVCLTSIIIAAIGYSYLSRYFNEQAKKDVTVSSRVVESQYNALRNKMMGFASIVANSPGIAQAIKDGKVPVMIVHGDIDEVVPVANSHAWVDIMKELKMNYEFVEQPGITHGPVIQSGLKPIYEFFAKHKK